MRVRFPQPFSVRFPVLWHHSTPQQAQPSTNTLDHTGSSSANMEQATSRKLSQLPAPKPRALAADEWEAVKVPPHVRSYTPDPGGTPNSSSYSPSLSSSNGSISSTLYFTLISADTLRSHLQPSSMKDRPLHFEDGAAPISSTASPRHPTTEAALQQESVTDEDYVLVSNNSEDLIDTSNRASACDSSHGGFRKPVQTLTKPFDHPIPVCDTAPSGLAPSPLQELNPFKAHPTDNQTKQSTQHVVDRPWAVQRLRRVSTACSKSAPILSILLMKQIRGTPYLSA